MYCTIDDLKKAIPESMLIRLSDDESEGDISKGTVQEAIDSAGAEIDGYIGDRLALPLDEPYPAVLVKFCADIAVYNVYSRLREEMPDTRKERYDNAIRFLERFADGKGYIGAGGEDAQPSAAHLVDTREKTFDFTKY